MNLNELLLSIPEAYFVDFDYVINLPEDAVPNVKNFESDSRKVTQHDVFVAVRGVAVDGHTYIGQALAHGAVAVVGELSPQDLSVTNIPFYIQVTNSREVFGWLHAALQGFPANALTLIGVTGTDGKTTTTNLLYSILYHAGFTAGMVSTVNARIGDKVFDTGLHTTTPDAPEVQNLLRQMQDAGVTHAVLEVTSHGLAQGRLAGCEFDVAVVTNITHEHLDYHGTWWAYADAKAGLFRNLLELHTKSSDRKTGILNYDDQPSYAFLSRIATPQTLVYGIHNDGVDVSAEDVTFSPSGLSFRLRYNEASIDVHSALVGLYNVSNILAAASAAIVLGVSLEKIALGVALMQGVPGRMECIDEGQDFLAIVDFAHTPNAMQRVLETARAMVEGSGRVIVVFGSAGLRDREKRRMMGEVAGQFADLIVITAEDPRTESLNDIVRHIAGGVESQNRVPERDYWCVQDRGAAIRFAVGMAHPGDIVLACGKGHEQSMCFGAIEYPWDDREAMRMALKGHSLSTLPTAKGYTQ